MRGIDVPDRTEDFTADPVELFFDLAFVFAFSRLVLWLVEHHTWRGVGEVALLFGLIWLAWSQFTWTANAISGNGRVIRILFLVATVATVPIGASISTAYGPGGRLFAISLAVILLMGPVTMVFSLDPDSAVFRSAVRYSVPNVLAGLLLVAGGFLDGSARTVAWILAFLSIVGGTIAAGSQEWIVRAGHFAERHGLIVIIALGEVIVAVGLPVVDALAEGDGLSGKTIVTLIATATFACLLWWGYFDRVLPAMEHRHEGHDGVESGRFARDVYSYAHMPIVAGIILAAAALEEIALHPSDTIPTAFRVMLAFGIGLNLLGVVIAVYRAFGAIARERLIGIVVGFALIALLADVAGYLALIIIDIALLIMLLTEHARVEGGIRPRRVSVG